MVGAEHSAEPEPLARPRDAQNIVVRVALLTLQHHAHALQMLSGHGVVFSHLQLVRLEVGDVQARAEPRAFG